jgi:hypothetical protein
LTPSKGMSRSTCFWWAHRHHMFDPEYPCGQYMLAPYGRVRIPFGRLIYHCQPPLR